MRIYQTASKKIRLLMTKNEWLNIGLKNNWAKIAKNIKKVANVAEKEIVIDVWIDEDVVAERGEVFSDEYDLGLKMKDKTEIKYIFDILKNQAKNQTGEIHIKLESEATWVSDKQRLPYGSTHVIKDDSGWESNKPTIIDAHLDFTDITGKKQSVRLSDNFCKDAYSALKDYIMNLDFDYGDPDDPYNIDYEDYYDDL